MPYGGEREPGPGQWIQLSNDGSAAVRVILEPYAIDFELAPGKSFDVFLCEEAKHWPEVVCGVGADIVIFASLGAIFQDGVELFNVSRGLVEGPPSHPWGTAKDPQV